MAEPTEVERLTNRIRGWWPDNHMLMDDVDALIAAVRAEALAEPTDDEWNTIYKASKFPDLISDNEALECAVFKFREIRGAK